VLHEFGVVNPIQSIFVVFIDVSHVHPFSGLYDSSNYRTDNGTASIKMERKTTSTPSSVDKKKVKQQELEHETNGEVGRNGSYSPVHSTPSVPESSAAFMSRKKREAPDTDAPGSIRTLHSHIHVWPVAKNKTRSE